MQFPESLELSAFDEDVRTVRSGICSASEARAVSRSLIETALVVANPDRV